MQDRNSDTDQDREAGDELSREVALGIRWDRHGLTVGGRSRFLAATDRLLGALVGIPAGYFEGVRERVELANASQREAILASARGALPAVGNGDSLAEATLRRFASEAVEKQLNRESVWQKTKDQLAASASTVDSTDGPPDSEELDRDWLNLFATHAERASSERLQTLWAQILAGEIREPRSFSLSTLRVISEIDAEIAEAFQEVVVHRVPIGDAAALIKPLDFRGDLLLRWTFLEEVGLLQGIGADLSIPLSTDPRPDFGFVAGDYVLRGTFKKGARAMRLEIVSLTRAARQIATILPQDPLGALSIVADRVKEVVSGLAIYHSAPVNADEITSRGPPLRVFPDR